MAVLRYFGHSAFELRLVGLNGLEKRVLIDPWISNPLSPVSPTDYVRRAGRIDYIFITHDHLDHVGDAEAIARETGATVVAVYDLAIELEARGLKAIGANIGGRISLNNLFAVLTPALHSSRIGSPTGVVVGGRDVRVYHAGDTGLFSEMEFIGRLYKPNIALLPIGGHFTMGVEEASIAVELIKPEIVVPMHYATFPVIAADPVKFKELVESKAKVETIILKPGEELIYP
ncbi:MAG: metal-dependent hydrolase [Sulfolobales archaeon]|nr:metal-dependent hydrolase [Sulfolobales archaeon]MCX8199181.1 metal-dependent hydrolase [Sulfolobales archaeon]MDW8170161.1 metal-dependent hydrolase [Desulfurococcaceae archaeon]